jgi:hypothetical protein
VPTAHVARGGHHVRAAASQRDAARGTTATSDTLPRPVPLGDNGWPLQPASETARAPRVDDQWNEPPPLPMPAPVTRPSPRSIDTLAGLAAELSSREDAAARPPLASEPGRSNHPAAPAPTHGDQNLAEMAQRLEASLRRPVAAATRPKDPAEAKPAATKSGYDSLEQEMASLLGRPATNKT